MSLIDKATEITSLASALEGQPQIALDTEFMRERTWFAELCLVQISDGDVIALVDPMRADESQRLVLPDAATLVLHSGEQDLEILSQADWRLPSMIYDTQVAAALVGEPLQVSYQQLVNKTLGVELQKGEQRSDWSRRPLSESQQRYAADDVRYLLPIKDILDERLHALGRAEWLRQDMQCWRRQLATHDDAASDQRAYLRIRAWSRMQEPARLRLKALAAWREGEARQRNLPRGWVVDDRQLIDVAEGAALPSTLKASLHKGMDATLQQVDTVARCETSAEDRQKQVESLISQVRKAAEALTIDPALIASRRELEALAVGEASPRLTLPWRKQWLAT
ncbi:HRDC domain-containing protein [Gammaproteobacteria bacterium]|nr:HRDC domain-containing protein [Gammaproteobacteria bacterium]